MDKRKTIIKLRRIRYITLKLGEFCPPQTGEITFIYFHSASATVAFSSLLACSHGGHRTELNRTFRMSGNEPDLKIKRNNNNFKKSGFPSLKRGAKNCLLMDGFTTIYNLQV